MKQKSASVQPDWLVMLFLGGGNDLFKFGENLLAEAKRVESTDRVKVVAEQDPTKSGAQTVRGQIVNGQWEQKVIGQTAGDPQTILEFVRDSNSEFAAQKKMLVLWDHGNGWQTTHVFGPIVQGNGIAPAVNATAAQSIAAIFEDGQSGVSLLCFDSCLMAMIEVVYQLCGMVDYIVASEHVVPADTGWPYTAILGTLAMRPHITPAQAACAIVDSFSGSYNSFEQAVTLSALEVSKVKAAVDAISGLASLLIAARVGGQGQKVMFARRYAQSFGNPDYIDIISFCDELQRQSLSDAIDVAAEQVKEQVAAMILAAMRGSALSVSRAHGLSIYFPERPMSSFYSKLDFAKPENCMWATFIAMMAQKADPPVPFVGRIVGNLQVFNEEESGAGPAGLFKTPTAPGGRNRSNRGSRAPKKKKAS